METVKGFRDIESDNRCFFNNRITFKPIDEFFYIPHNYNIEELTLEELKDFNEKARYSTEKGGRLVFITKKTEFPLKLTQLNGNKNILISDIISEIDKITPVSRDDFRKKCI